jgi:DnaJ like chaperone protein
MRIERFAKWIGGGLGWTLAGPVGGVMGFIAGYVFDKQTDPANQTSRSMGDFAVSLLALIAAVMKADEKVLKSELNYVKRFLWKNFGEKESENALAVLRDLLKKPISVEIACRQLYRYLDYSSRLQLTNFLCQLANIDSPVSLAEQRVLDAISTHLGVSIEPPIVSVFAETAINAAYATLEIDRHATIQEIKKAYRFMAVKCHPDKVAYLGDDARKTANEQLQKLNKVYTLIKKERNFS